MEAKKVLGVRVNRVSIEETLVRLDDWLTADAGGVRLVTTAYSEFFVTAQTDRDFRMALESSDLVVPDGIGPLAAIRYQERARGRRTIGKIIAGLMIGAEIIGGKVGRPVAGYSLFKELAKRASKKDWRVFLLGGFDDTAARVAAKLRGQYPDLAVEFSGGSQAADKSGAEDETVMAKINRFKPDLLFVAYGPVKQEKWLAANRGKLAAKVAMGVGGTFDEYLGKVKEAPEIWSRLGLKWLWRLIQQPRRIGRIWKAVVVFPWLVFRESL